MWRHCNSAHAAYRNLQLTKKAQRSRRAEPLSPCNDAFSAEQVCPWVVPQPQEMCEAQLRHGTHQGADKGQQQARARALKYRNQQELFFQNVGYFVIISFTSFFWVQISTCDINQRAHRR